MTASINFNSLYLDSKHCKLYLGNVLTVLKSLPAASVDMCMTSPPYWSLRSYQTQPQIWDEDPQCSHVFHERKFTMHNGRGDAQKSAKYSEQVHIPDREMTDTTCSECGAWKGELGLEPTPSMFINHLVTIFDEIYRVLKPTGSLWVNLGDTYSGSGGAGGDYNEGGLREGQPRYRQTEKPKDTPRKSLCLIPERFAIAMIDRQWILRNKIIWSKPNSMPNSVKDRFSVSHETVFFFTKSLDYFFEQQFEPYKTTDTKGDERFGDINKQQGYGNCVYSGNPWEPDPELGRIMRDVWTINTQSYEGTHFATFPEKLCEIPIKAGCPEFICNRCGHARTTQYKEIRIDTRPGRDTGTGKSGSLDDPNAGLHNSELSTKRQQIVREECGMSDCGCRDAGWHPGVVLDPFCGSGTTGLVALKLARDFIGVELNPQYLELAKKRLDPYLNQERLF